MPSLYIKGIGGNLPVDSCLENRGTLCEQHICTFSSISCNGGSVDAQTLKISRLGGIAGQLQFCQGIQSDVTWRMTSMMCNVKGWLVFLCQTCVALYGFVVVVACCNVDIQRLSLNF